MLRGPGTLRVPIESILASLVNAIDATTSIEKIILILDDFHVITRRPTLDTLEFLIARQPPRLHLVISSRTDPPLAMARRRAAGELAELRAADLRFSLDEAKEFFVDTMGLALSDQHIGRLEESSEGWIAGMQLAACSMQGRRDISEFIDSFAGSNRYILDYLIEEVLRRQSQETQSFLLQTSILDRLSASLCDALTLGKDSQTTLECLERANLFITPLDDTRCWYRYHHLFADFLRHYLWRSRAEAIPELYRRASEWYGANGHMAEAISSSLAARDFERAAALVESLGVSMLVTGDFNLLLSWLDALPPLIVRSRPELCLYKAWAHTLGGRADQAEGQIEQLERQAPERSDKNFIMGSVFAMRGTLACIQQDTARTLELSRRALELLPANELIVRSSVLLDAANAYLMEGSIVEASRAYAEALTATELGGNSMGSVLAKGGLISAKARQGHLREAADDFDHLRRFKPGGVAVKPPYAGPACLEMGEVSYEWDDLESARSYAVEGLAFGQQWGRPTCVAAARIQMCKLARAEGDWAEAANELDAAREALGKNVLPRLASLIEACRARLVAERGDLETAANLMQERGLHLTDSPDFRNEPEYVTLAWLHVQRTARTGPAAALSQALALLDRARANAEAAGRMGSVIEMLAIRSMALWAMGDAAKATSAVQQALAAAEPDGYLRTFVDLGQLMLLVLRHAASQGIFPDYVATLSEAFGRDASRRPLAAVTITDKVSPVRLPCLVERLSERELEVLRLVADGRSNREIADRLVLAIGTVKRHVNNIFGKLGVGSRLQAVSRARELGLL